MTELTSPEAGQPTYVPPLLIGPGHPDWMTLVQFDDRVDRGGYADAWDDHPPRFTSPELRGIASSPVQTRLLQLDHVDVVDRWWNEHSDGDRLLDEHRRQADSEAEAAFHREFGWPAGA